MAVTVAWTHVVYYMLACSRYQVEAAFWQLMLIEQLYGPLLVDES